MTLNTTPSSTGSGLTIALGQAIGLDTGAPPVVNLGVTTGSTTPVAPLLGVGVSLGGATGSTGSTTPATTTPPLIGLGVAVGVGTPSTGSTGATGVGLGVDVGLGGSTGTGVGVGVNGGLSLGGVNVGLGTSVGVGVGVGVGTGTGGSGTGTGGTGTGGTGTAGTGTGGAGGGGTGTGGAGTGTGAGTGAGGAGTGTGGAAGTAMPDPHSAFINIFRLGGASEIPANVNTQLNALDAQIASGAITAKQAVLQIVNAAAGFTAVAETTYQFFTGLTPTAAGLNYLVHSTGNAADLSDGYYDQFNLENRYINFASNLGLHSDFAPEFARVFGAMSFNDAVATAYERIVGSTAASAAGINAATAISDITARRPYFEAVAHERFAGDDFALSTKLAAVAYIMEEAVRANVGNYGEANQNFLFDLADGNAQFNINLVGVYGHGTPLDVA